MVELRDAPGIDAAAAQWSNALVIDGVERLSMPWLIVVVFGGTCW
jgi:hypothetical protein